MENNKDIPIQFISLLRRPSRFRRVVSSNSKNTLKIKQRIDRNESLANKQKYTIETEGALIDRKFSLRGKGCQLPQLTISKGKHQHSTLEPKGYSKEPDLNRIQTKIDQFQCKTVSYLDAFPRRMSDMQYKYSVTQSSQSRQLANTKRRNYPKLVKSNFPFGQQILVRKPFSQQLKKRSILQPKNSNRKFQDQFQSKELFTFYPKQNKQDEMINQFLYIR